MYLTAWVGTFLLNFLLNLVFPAVSPRIYIADEYRNEVRGTAGLKPDLCLLHSERGNFFSARSNVF